MAAECIGVRAEGTAHVDTAAATVQATRILSWFIARMVAQNWPAGTADRGYS
jgi:hypothetical protein